MHYPSHGYHVQLLSKSGPPPAKSPNVRLRKRTLSYGASNLQYDSSNVTYVEDAVVEEEMTEEGAVREEEEKEEEEEGVEGDGKENNERKKGTSRSGNKPPASEGGGTIVDDASRLRHRASLSKMTMLTCYVVTLFLFTVLLLPSTAQSLAANESSLPAHNASGRIDVNGIADVEEDRNSSRSSSSYSSKDSSNEVINGRFPRDLFGDFEEVEKGGVVFERRGEDVIHVVRVIGSDVELPCHIAGPGNVVIGQDPGARLKWIKRNPPHRQPITDGEHVVIDNWEKRFELSRDNYTLRIKNVELMDGARYQCTTVSRPMVDGHEKARRPSATVFLTVFEPPECQPWDPLGTGQWAADNINFGGSCSTVARGGAKPALEWSRASTGQSGLGTPDIYPGDPPMILSSFYFQPTHEDQGTNLTCELIHPHLQPEDVGKYTCVIGPMEILFDVIFFCDSEQFVDPDDSEFNVTCDVRANPPVDPNHLYWIPQNLDKPPLSDLINTSDCWQARQKTFQTSSYMVDAHVTRTTVTVDKHLDKFVDSLDFILQARLNSKKNISMLILDPNAERRMIQGFDEDLFISMLMIIIGGVIVLSALLVVFVFGAFDWYQSFRPRDYDYSYEKLRKIEATKRVAEKAANSNATIASANAAAAAAAAATANSNDTLKPQTRVPPAASAVNRRLHNRHSMISSLSS